MGIDLNAMFGQASDSAKQGMSDLLKQGGNAGLGFLEGQAISTLQADQAQHVSDYQKSVQDQLNKPSSPFGQYLSSITQAPIIKQYGVYILGGIGIIVVATLLLRK